MYTKYTTYTILTTLCATMACSPDFGMKNGGFDNNNGNSLDSNNNNDIESLSGLPSLENQMEPDYCENVQPDVAGATSYFMGTYLLDSNGWRGTEQWILHPTSSWTATHGETCYVTWEIVATETDVTGCPNCDLSLDVSGSLNRQETDCPDGLWENEEQWSTTYNILVDNTQAIFYFQSDGDMVGEGYANSKALSFLSEVSCSWF